MNASNSDIRNPLEPSWKTSGGQSKAMCPRCQRCLGGSLKGLTAPWNAGMGRQGSAVSILQVLPE